MNTTQGWLHKKNKVITVQEALLYIHNMYDACEHSHITLLTIQKRVPVAKSAYSSIVDRTLKIRHTRTIRKLYEDKTCSLVSLSLFKEADLHFS